jgi:hypothetical protein
MQYPCRFHRSRGETYNHSAANCRLPEAVAWQNCQNIPQPQNQNNRFANPNMPPCTIAQGAVQSPSNTPRVEIINYGDMGPNSPTNSYEPNQEFYDANGDLSFDVSGSPNYDEGSQMEYNESESYQSLRNDESSESHPRDMTSNYHTIPRPSFGCEVCKASFSSRNKLFKHIRLMNYQVSPSASQRHVITNLFANMGSEPEVIYSDAPPLKNDGLSFRDYNYLEIAMRTSPKSLDKSVCADTGCGMSCIDRTFFAQEYPHIQTSVIEPIEIRGLGGKMTMSNEYAVLPVYFPGYKPGSKVKALARVEKEIHIVDNLSCNALIGNDILKPEKMSIDLEMQQIRIGSCGGLTCPIRIVPRDKPITNRLVRTTGQSYLKRHAKTLIPVRIKDLPPDRDFRFVA